MQILPSKTAFSLAFYRASTFLFTYWLTLYCDLLILHIFLEAQDLLIQSFLVCCGENGVS